MYLLSKVVTVLMSKLSVWATRARAVTQEQLTHKDNVTFRLQLHTIRFNSNDLYYLFFCVLDKTVVVSSTKNNICIFIVNKKFNSEFPFEKIKLFK